MRPLTPLQAEALYTFCDPAVLDFPSTEALPELDVSRIHPRAVEALRLGLDIKHKGYNLFVLGEPGSGRHSIIRDLLQAECKDGEPAADWCYVNNFTSASHPRLLRLPAGRGARLRDDMQHFVAELGSAIAAGFESDEYNRRIESLREEEKQREENGLRALGQDAAQRGIALLRTPQGFAFAPLKNDQETLSQEEFEKLPEERQKELSRHIDSLHEQLHKLTNEFPHWRRDLRNQIKEARSEVLRLAVGHLIEELKSHYADLPRVVEYLDAVMQDIVETGESLRESSRSEEDAETTFYTGSISVQRYLVNLLVENTSDGARPLVYEDHPTLQNLVGRIEHILHLGILVSNFTLIQAGSLHRANGGFLVLDALRVLQRPYAWEGLKRVLRSGEIRIESLSELIGITSTLQLEPEPVPIDLKLVLIGDRQTYYLLTSLDPDFAELFKINADMDSQVERNPENTLNYARLVGTLARREGLRHISSEAVARVIEHAARLAGDAQRLTTQTRLLDDLLLEANHFAAQASASLIEREHVEAALDAHDRRNERVRQRYQEEILRGQWLVDTSGVHVGQINGLAMVLLGEGTFAHPVRISATVHLGEGEVVDIEREVELGGPLHSKGVLILSSFLAARFGWNLPLSLKASLVFEQSYGGVEGDSASLAELAALLSALAGIPIHQSLAVTGSVNQFGVVQPVSGINEKIEGFFAICSARGLSGEQGVLIPAANTGHLMLRHDVVEAVKQGHFHIWPVNSVDDAMELLTGMPAGEPDDKGNVPEGSVNFQIAMQLAELAQLRQTYRSPQPQVRRKRKAAQRRNPAKPSSVPPGKSGRR
ncbi:MAG: ATP-binding protein [Thiobacillaceae bacterium]